MTLTLTLTTNPNPNQVDELMEGDVTLESFFDTLDARVQTKVCMLTLTLTLGLTLTKVWMLTLVALASPQAITRTHLTA